MSFTKITGAFIAANTITSNNIASNVSLGGGDTSPRITSIGYPGDDTAADVAGGQTITINGANFANGAAVYLDMVAVGSATVVNANTITITAPARATGSYVVYVINADGGTAIHVPGIQYSGVPAWTTAAGSLGTVYETRTYANTVVATGDAPVTYSLASGSLPPGATLAANGQLSGTAGVMTGSTTYNFTIRATDAQNQDTDRAFSLTVASDVVTWSSPADNATIALDQDVPSTTTLSATSAAGYNITYSANTLPTGLSISGSSITGTPTVTANTTTLLTATANTTNRTATRTVTWVVALGFDPSRSQVVTHLSPVMPVAPYNADASNNNFAVTAIGGVRPNNFNPYTPGFYSNFFDGTGDFLDFPSNAAFGYGTGDFTIEFWAYFTSISSSTPNLIDQRSGISIQVAPTLYLNNGVLQYYVSGSNRWSGSTLVPNRWYHIAVSRSSGTTRFFVDGVQDGASYTDPNNYITSPVRVFASNDNNASVAQAGHCSNLRIVKGTALYTANFTPSTTPLTAIANTSLLTCQSNRLIDNSTNNFTATRNGDVRVSGFAPFTPNPSFSAYGSTFFVPASNTELVTAQSNTVSFGTGDFTAELWMYPTAFGGQAGDQFSCPLDVSTGTSQFQFRVYLFSSNNQLVLKTAWGADIVAVSGLAPNQWYHVAVSRVGTNTRAFLNGVQIGTTRTTLDDYGTNSRVNIGNEWGTLSRYFSGHITDVRLIKGTGIYTANFTPPSAPLTAVANTSLLTCQTDQPINNHSFIDNSTNNLPTTRNGNVSQGTFSPYGENWSNYFNGANTYLTFSNNARFAFGTGAFTIEFWVNLPSGTDDRFILGGRSAIGTMHITTGGAAGSTAGTLRYVGSSTITSGSTLITDNLWHHCAIVRNASNTVTLYVDGVSRGTGTDTTNYTTATGTWAAGVNDFNFPSSLGNYLLGYMSNLRIVNGTALYTSNFTPSTTPLQPIANTVLLTCADNRFIDDSPNNFTITRNGDVSVQEFGPFPGTALPSPAYSVFFDGTGDSLTVPNSGTFNFGAPSGNTNDFCIEFWAYQNNSSITTLVGTAYSAGINNYWMITTNRRGTDGANVAGTINFYMTDSFYIESTSGFNANVWNHVVACRTGTTVSLFLNGTRVATGTSSVNPSATGLLQIGGEPSQLGRLLTGYISNLRITRGSTQPYSATSTSITVPTSSLTAITNTNLLACQNNTVVDNSPNNFAITVNGDSRPTIFNPFTPTYSTKQSYTPAVFGGSAYFDGNADFLTFDSSNICNFGTGNFTVEFWMMGMNTDVNIMDVRSAQSAVPWGIDFNASRIPSWYNGSSNQGSTAIPAGQWAHVAFVRSGTTHRIFINGVQTHSFTDSTNYGTMSTAGRIGASTSNVRYFQGYISDLRIVKGTAVYTSNFVPQNRPLAANTNTVALFNMASAGVYDSASLANFETTGDAKIVTSPRQYSNTSIFFDGTGDSLTIPGNPNLDFGTGNFTIEFWWYPNAIGFQPLVYHTNSSTVTGTGHYGIVNTTGNGLRFYYNGGGTGTVSQGSQTGTTAGQWYHIAVVRNSGTITIYRNGVSVASGPNNLQVGLASNPMTIGSGENGFTNSYISDLRITRGVARYTANFTPPTAALLTS